MATYADRNRRTLIVASDDGITATCVTIVNTPNPLYSSFDLDGDIGVVLVDSKEIAPLLALPLDDRAAAGTFLRSTLNKTADAVATLKQILENGTMAKATHIGVLCAGSIIRGTIDVMDAQKDLMVDYFSIENLEAEVKDTTAADLAALANAMQLVETPFKIGKGFKLKDREAIETVVLARLQSKKEANKPKAAAKSTSGAARTGVKPGIRAYLESGKKAGLEKFQELFPTATASSIKTAISDLKNAKYAGEGGALDIKKDDKGVWYLEK